MHYKNGRSVTVGDWVIGPTHNSEGKVVIGIVVEEMPKQGPCNVRLHSWKSFNLRPIEHTDDYRIALHFQQQGKPMALDTGSADYADAKELVHVIDAYNMLAAVTDHGDWKTGNFQKKML